MDQEQETWLSRYTDALDMGGKDDLPAVSIDPTAAEQDAPVKPVVETPQFLGDAVGDNISTTSTIGVNQSINGVVDHNGDFDYYRITLTAGQAYHFTLYGGSMNDPYLEVRDSTGALVGEDDDGGAGTNSSLMFVAPTSGTYYLVARDFSTGTGTYTLASETIQTGNSSPTQFPANNLPMFSWDQAALQLTRKGASWNNTTQGAAVTVTYAFRSTAPTTMPDDTAGFQRFTAAQIAAAEAALQAWAEVANINFVRVGAGTTGDGAYSDNAAILFGNYSSGVDGAAAFAYLPSSGNQSASSVQGDVWVNISIAENQNFAAGSYGNQTLLHEIGHALGLSHPADYNAGAGQTITYENSATYFNDSRVFTVMTYFGSPPVGGSLGGFATTPQMHDIAAVQELYGARTTTRTGDTVYGFNSNANRAEFVLTSASQSAVFTIWDSGGNDTLDLSGYSQNATIDLRQEGYSSAGPSSSGAAIYNISIARGVVIENAIGGSGADTIIGNAVANTLSGGLGADTILGGAGGDVLLGQDGADTLSGEDGADVLQGGNGNDWMVGGNGDDTIIGGEQGTNVLIGGAGLDVASYANVGGNLWVDLNAGVYSAAGVWDSFVEMEGLIGGSGNDTLFGNDVNNYLVGNSGADTLVGRLGDDLLIGGLGDDWLEGGDGNDLLEGGAGVNVLQGGLGTDLASYTLSSTAIWFDLGAGAYSAPGIWDALVSIEGASGSNFADNLFGDAGNNRLLGNGGDDALIGLGGADRLEGGAGNDWIVGGDGNDRLIGGDGVDVLTGGAGADIFDLGTGAGWDVAFDFNPAEDTFYLGGLQWLGFLTYDADGDGQADDTLLGYAGGNFVALNVSGLTLAQWNALVSAPAGDIDADKFIIDAHPEVLPVLTSPGASIDLSPGLDMVWDLGLDATARGFRPENPFVLQVNPDQWAPLAA